MTRKVVATLLLLGVASAGAVGCASQASAFTAAFVPGVQSEHACQDYLEHRGRFYALDDLMDPEYRRNSPDKFVRDFEPDKMVGVPWAGIGGDSPGLEGP